MISMMSTFPKRNVISVFFNVFFCSFSNRPWFRSHSFNSNLWTINMVGFFLFAFVAKIYLPHGEFSYQHSIPLPFPPFFCSSVSAMWSPIFPWEKTLQIAFVMCGRRTVFTVQYFEVDPFSQKLFQIAPYNHCAKYIGKTSSSKLNYT